MSLNPAQKTAVEHLAGPLLIVAGAGAGKTKTITERIGHLLTKGVAPDRILAITFTNKAARELRERVGNEQVFVSTFHALGVHILRDNAQKLGLNRNFTIFDKDDSSREVKSILLELGFDPKSLEPRRVLGGISRAKGDGLNRASYRANAHSGFFADTVSNVWQRYEENLQKQKALDFDDLLLKTTELLERETNILDYYRERWHYLHIDEYQDTNAIQYRLAKLLAGERKNICVVGDVDQSIYSWRGADFRNLLRFEKDFPEAKVVLLEENYRSTQNILTAANEVIKQNRERHDKKLFTRNLVGEKISLSIALDEKEEAQLVAEKCSKLIREGKNPNEIAILYRANFQSRVLEEALLRSDVPYQVLGTKFLERQEIKDVLSYLRASLNEDDIVSVKRAINLPPRGLGKVTLAKIFSNQEGELSPKVRAKLAEFRNILQTIREAIPVQKPSDLIRTVVEQTGLAKMWREGGPEERERLENAKELATLALRYNHFPPQQGTEKFLDDTALASDQDSLDEKDKKKVGVKLMTVHAAKGLEFQIVFIIGLEQDLFPHRGREDENETRDTEEERRLFYVALTRAKEKLFLSYAQLRTIYGSRQVTLPSEFLGNIPSELLETENEPSSFIDF